MCWLLCLIHLGLCMRHKLLHMYCSSSIYSCAASGLSIADSLQDDVNFPRRYNRTVDGQVQFGKVFLVHNKLLKDLGLPQRLFMNLTGTTAHKLEFITAASSDHFAEAQVAIARVQFHRRSQRIIFYDIGLTPDQSEEVSDERWPLQLWFLMIKVLWSSLHASESWSVPKAI